MPSPMALVDGEHSRRYELKPGTEPSTRFPAGCAEFLGADAQSRIPGIPIQESKSPQNECRCSSKPSSWCCSTKCRPQPHAPARAEAPRRRWRECVYCRELFNKSVLATPQQEDDARKQFGESAGYNIPGGVCPECACFWLWAEQEFFLPDGMSPKTSVKPFCTYTLPARSVAKASRQPSLAYIEEGVEGLCVSANRTRGQAHTPENRARPRTRANC